MKQTGTSLQTFARTSMIGRMGVRLTIARRDMHVPGESEGIISVSTPITGNGTTSSCETEMYCKCCLSAGSCLLQMAEKYIVDRY